MLLPTTYTSAFLLAFSWTNLFPSGFQIPQFSWPTAPQTEFISPQPPQLLLPTSSQPVTPTPTTKPSPTPTIKPLVTPKPTTTPTPKPTAKQLLTSTPNPTATPPAKPTVKPTIQPSATPKPTSKPSATPTVKPTITTTPAPAATLLDSKQQYILNQINQYRLDNSLSPVKADKYTCDFAKVRAQEIAGNFNHDGFTSRSNSKSLPYPSYHNVTENIAMTSDYQQVVTMWKNSSGHAANMRSDTPYVCVAYSGSYYAYEGWKP